MSVRSSIWKVGARPQLLKEARLPSEHALEQMIVAEPHTQLGSDLAMLREVSGRRIFQLLVDRSLNYPDTPAKAVNDRMDQPLWKVI